MQKKGFFTRLWNLWRGFWGHTIDGAETRNAELVYHNAIADRQRHYEKLKDAVGRLVYLRNQIEADLLQKRDDLKLVEGALLKAASADDDATALPLVRKQRELHQAIERLSDEHERLRQQSEDSKTSLGELVVAIRKLQQERDEMVARKQHATARLQIASAVQNTLQQNSTGAQRIDTALENVRESIVRLETQAGLALEHHRTEDEVSLAELRKQAEEDADKEALTAIKRRLGKGMITSGEPLEVVEERATAEVIQ